MVNSAAPKNLRTPDQNNNTLLVPLWLPTKLLQAKHKDSKQPLSNILLHKVQWTKNRNSYYKPKGITSLTKTTKFFWWSSISFWMSRSTSTYYYSVSNRNAQARQWHTLPIPTPWGWCVTMWWWPDILPTLYKCIINNIMMSWYII